MSSTNWHEYEKNIIWKYYVEDSDDDDSNSDSNNDSTGNNDVDIECELCDNIITYDNFHIKEVSKLKNNKETIFKKVVCKSCSK